MTAGPEEIALAIARLRAGGVVAFPTETVYGLGADAFNAAAVDRVFALKGRPAHNPLIVHLSDETMARRVAAPGAWTREASALARAFWPGPLTIVVARAIDLPEAVTAGGPTVGVRAPDHHIALALIEGFGGPLVGPSANPSGGVSPTSSSHVRATFTEEDVQVLDGGPCRRGIESTVVSLSETARVLRPGLVSAEQIAAVLGRPVAAATGEVAAGHVAAPSPGLAARHYAPRTRTVVFAAAAWPGVLPKGRAAVLSSRLTSVPAPHVLLPMPKDADDYAARLYAALREADALGFDLIAVERPDEPGPVWEAIRDRLRRATGSASDAP